METSVLILHTLAHAPSSILYAGVVFHHRDDAMLLAVVVPPNIDVATSFENWSVPIFQLVAGVTFPYKMFLETCLSQSRGYP